MCSDELSKKLDESADVLRGAVLELRQQLPLDRQTQLGVAGHLHKDARAYFAYTCSDEILRTLHRLPHWKRFTQERRETQQAESSGQACLDELEVEAVSQEQRTCLRKLVETLVDLICFSDTNQADYYRLYLVCRELETALGALSDMQEFLACDSRNLASGIKGFTDFIDKIEDGIRQSLAPGAPEGWDWFLRPHRKASDLRVGRVFTSWKSRFTKALKKADLADRIALGFTYFGWYGTASKWIHSLSVRTTPRVSLLDVEKHCWAIFVSASEVVFHCYELTGLPLGENAEKLKELTQVPDELARFMDAFLMKSANVGDFVIAQGTTAEVVDKSTSEYGYCSVEVEFLGDSPVPQLKRDWVPAFHVRLLMTAGEAPALLSEYLGSRPAFADVAAVFDKSLVALRRALRQVAVRGHVDDFQRFVISRIATRGKDAK